VRADKGRPVAGECGAPIRTQGFAFAAAWRRQSSPCGLTAGARPLTSRCADGGARRFRTTGRYRWSRRSVCEGADQWGTTGREAGLRYSAGRAQRGRVVPLHSQGHCTLEAVAGIATGANEALRLLADRAEARGSERERAQARGLRDLRRRLILLPPTGAPRMRKATTQQSNNPRRGRESRRHIRRILANSVACI